MYTFVEIALCVMIATWTLVSVGFGVLAYLVYTQVREAINRVNQLLATGQHVAEDVRAPVHAVAESVREVFAPMRQAGDPLPTI